MWRIEKRGSSRSFLISPNSVNETGSLQGVGNILTLPDIWAWCRCVHAGILDPGPHAADGAAQGTVPAGGSLIEHETKNPEKEETMNQSIMDQ